MALDDGDKNAKIDEFRRQLVRREVPLDSVDESEVSATAGGSFGSRGAADVAEFREVRESVQAAVAELPEWQSLALRLKYFEGLTSEAISERTGRSLRTVERDLSQGRSSVEKSLVRGGIFHPEFGLAALVAVVPSSELLSLSKAIGAGASAAGSGHGPSSVGPTLGAGVSRVASPVSKLVAVLVGLALVGGLRMRLWPSSPSVISKEQAGAGIGEVDGAVASAPGASNPAINAANERKEIEGSGLLGNPAIGERTAASGEAPEQRPAAAAMGAPLNPLAMTLVVTDHGEPVTGMAVSLNFKDASGRNLSRYPKGPGSELHVEEADPGVYSVHADLSGKFFTVIAAAPVPDKPVNNTSAALSEGYYYLRVEAIVQEEPETVTVSLNTEPRCFEVELTEGKDYDLASGISPSFHFAHVCNLSPAVWLVAHPRLDTIVEFAPSSSVPRWSTPYDGKLRFVATEPNGGDIRRANGSGSTDLWLRYTSAPAPYD